jgi:hypothetical protein
VRPVLSENFIQRLLWQNSLRTTDQADPTGCLYYIAVVVERQLLAAPSCDIGQANPQIIPPTTLVDTSPRLLRLHASA